MVVGVHAFDQSVVVVAAKKAMEESAIVVVVVEDISMVVADLGYRQW